MRCRPGDLAIVVSGMPQENIGRIITVRQHVRALGIFLGNSVDLWTYEGDLRGFMCSARAEMIEDACLRPLRDPGDAAVDEVVQRVGRASELPVYASVSSEARS